MYIALKRNNESASVSAYTTYTYQVYRYITRMQQHCSRFGPSRRLPPSLSALHGKALVGSHHSYKAGGRSSKRPYTPAITPGEQPYGVSHPLSPTSMGSPPRRHRNSNWGEEGTRLAEEEEENSRRTAPFIVSGTMLG